MPGLSVRPGDRVREGQVIAKLGSTGQASQPHLHFHVADADFPLAEGLPYHLKGFRILGAHRSIEEFSQGEPWHRSAVPAQASAPRFPEPNLVVEFPGG
jgi:murein DD-endopeptidase